LETAAVLIGFAALALYLTWPLARDLDGRIFGLPGDSTGTIALLWSFAEETGYHVLGTTEMKLTGAPFGWEFPNALNIQWAVVFVPAVLATKVVGEVAAYNLVVLSGLALSGPAMYLLVRRLGAHPMVSAWAGLVYTIFPWHLEKAQGHAGFVHLEGFPLLVLAVIAWYRKPVVSRALLVAAASLFLWMTAGYFGLLGAIALAVLLPAVAALHVRQLGWRRAITRLALAGSTALAVAGFLTVVTALGSTPEGVAPSRSVDELSTYGARYWEYVLPSYRNPLFGDDVGSYLFVRLHGSNFSETSLYLGWLTITLAAVWLAIAFVRRHVLPPEHVVVSIALPLLVLVALVFSLPSPLPKTDVQTPARLLWEFVPQFRVPSRFVVLVMTGLVCLGALGLEALRRSVLSLPLDRRLASALAAGLCIAAIGISILELSMDVEPSTTEVDHVPVYYRAVMRAPEGILAEYPLVRADQGLNSDYLFWQRVHERPLVNGAQLGTFADAVGQSLVNPASSDTAPSLAALGVSTIVLRPNVFVLTGNFEAPRQLGAGYKLLGRYSGETSVWEVVARPAPAMATFTKGFSHTETPSQQATSRWMVSSEAEVDIYAWRAGTYLARFQLSSYGQPRVIRVGGQNDFELAAVFSPRTVTVPVRLPRGRSFMKLSSRPGPQPVPDGRSVTVYVSNWRFLPMRGSRTTALEAFSR
jgi:hypothetical protein